MCNLCQNPHKVPVCGIWAPALLRGGKLWVLLRPGPDGPDDDAVAVEERWLLPDEHPGIMGIPQYAMLCGSHHRHPHIGVDLPAGAKRSLAGNVPCSSHRDFQCHESRVMIHDLYYLTQVFHTQLSLSHTHTRNSFIDPSPSPSPSSFLLFRSFDLIYDICTFFLGE